MGHEPCNAPSIDCFDVHKLGLDRSYVVEHCVATVVFKSLIRLPCIQSIVPQLYARVLAYNIARIQTSIRNNNESHAMGVRVDRTTGALLRRTSRLYVFLVQLTAEPTFAQVSMKQPLKQSHEP